MEIVIEFNDAAFRHGVSRESIAHAIQNYLYDDLWDIVADKHLLIGFDQNRNLLEIMYNVIDERAINVFHAMKCRNIFLKLLDM
ncbi:hypothetical protein AGMMS50256_04670 [Betaproteobacteria bacterium]|nr:hypothetical protein AGMMS50256_04670 [Betaproteobacteria bacterium]